MNGSLGTYLIIDIARRGLASEVSRLRCLVNPLYFIHTIILPQLEHGTSRPPLLKNQV